MSGRKRRRLSDCSSEASSVSLTSTADGNNSDEHYEIDEPGILKEQEDSDGDKKFFVKWKNYDESWNTWEPESSFDDPITLKEWDDRRMRITRGLTPEFDLEDWERRVDIIRTATTKRKLRRREKRKRLGLGVSPSESSDIESSSDTPLHLKASTVQPSSRHHTKNVAVVDSDSDDDSDTPLVNLTGKSRSQSQPPAPARLAEVANATRPSTSEDILPPSSTANATLSGAATTTTQQSHTTTKPRDGAASEAPHPVRWTSLEKQTLVDGLKHAEGPYWGKILKWHGPQGHVSKLLQSKTKADLRDCALQMRAEFVDVGREPPEWLAKATDHQVLQKPAAKRHPLQTPKPVHTEPETRMPQSSSVPTTETPAQKRRPSFTEMGRGRNHPREGPPPSTNATILNDRQNASSLPKPSQPIQRPQEQQVSPQPTVLSRQAMASMPKIPFKPGPRQAPRRPSAANTTAIAMVSQPRARGSTAIRGGARGGRGDLSALLSRPKHVYHTLKRQKRRADEPDISRLVFPENIEKPAHKLGLIRNLPAVDTGGESFVRVSPTLSAAASPITEPPVPAVVTISRMQIPEPVEPPVDVAPIREHSPLFIGTDDRETLEQPPVKLKEEEPERAASLEPALAGIALDASAAEERNDAENGRESKQRRPPQSGQGPQPSIKDSKTTSIRTGRVRDIFDDEESESLFLPQDDDLTHLIEMPADVSARPTSGPAAGLRKAVEHDAIMQANPMQQDESDLFEDAGLQRNVDNANSQHGNTRSDSHESVAFSLRAKTPRNDRYKFYWTLSKDRSVVFGHLRTGDGEEDLVRVCLEGIDRAAQKWILTIKDGDNVHFDVRQRCSVLDFQAFFYQHEPKNVCSGYFLARDKRPDEGLETLAQDLAQTLSGAIFFADHYTMVIYPQGASLWQNFDQSPTPQPALLRFAIRDPLPRDWAETRNGDALSDRFRKNPEEFAVLQETPTKDDDGNNMNAVFRDLYNIDYRQLLGPEKARFVLCFLPFGDNITPQLWQQVAEEHDLVYAFLKSNGAEVFSTQIPGLGNPDMTGRYYAYLKHQEPGVMLIHHQCRRLNEIRSLAKSVLPTTCQIWRISLSPMPTIESHAHLTRLFPHGAVILLTQSLILYQSADTLRFLMWFRLVQSKAKQTRWKIAVRPQIRAWLQSLTALSDGVLMKMLPDARKHVFAEIYTELTLLFNMHDNHGKTVHSGLHDPAKKKRHTGDGGNDGGLDEPAEDTPLIAASRIRALADRQEWKSLANDKKLDANATVLGETETDKEKDKDKANSAMEVEPDHTAIQENDRLLISWFAEWACFEGCRRYRRMTVLLGRRESLMPPPPPMKQTPPPAAAAAAADAAAATTPITPTTPAPGPTPASTKFEKDLMYYNRKYNHVDTTTTEKYFARNGVTPLQELRTMEQHRRRALREELALLRSDLGGLGDLE